MSRSPTPLFGLVAVLALSTGCDKVRAVVCLPDKASAKVAARTSDKQSDAGAEEPKEIEPAARAAAADGGSGDAHLTSAGTQTAFALPFAWEKSPQEPLARARTFLREVADDNTAYMAKGPEFFRAFANSQTPRATVIACADSRVQAGAFDASPENDDFTVRNIGNQVETALGSVEYGIDHLHTPVLMILGHTGCGAVKAAMQDKSSLPAPIRREIDRIHVHVAGGKGLTEDRKWLNAVIENIHDQVKQALRRFGPSVNAGDLTIVGAIYDFRNDLGQGAGRLAVIDVNGIDDPARLKSFVDAIMSSASHRGSEDAMTRLARALADPGPAEDHTGEEDQVIPH
jgi:carbonic anhydrase